MDSKAIASLEQQILSKKRQKSLSLEKQIYSLLFAADEFTSHDLIITETEFLHYTIIRKIPETPKNVLIVLHGYGGFGGVFYRLMAEIANKFFIILVDLPNMGFSSRQKEDLFSDTDTAIQYFTTRLEIFIDKMQMKEFSLMGHSIGAYLATHLHQKMHERILKLYLLSPAGFNHFEDPILLEKKKKFLDEMGFIKRCMVESVTKKIYEDKKSPFELFWVPTFLRKWALKKYWLNGRFKMTKAEAHLFYKIQFYFLELPQAGERCLGHLLYFGVSSKRPLIDVLLNMRDHSKKVRMFFGENDWMDGHICQNNMIKNELEIPVHFISDSEHQLIFQNPHEIAMRIFEDDSDFLENEIK